jgi:hypothetical protein
VAALLIARSLLRFDLATLQPLPAAQQPGK